MKFYRYQISKTIHTPSVQLEEYELGVETKHGYWICMSGISMDLWKKWVSKNGRRRWAYPSKEEAMKNFRLRTQSRVRHLEISLRMCKYALALIPGITCDDCRHESCPMRGEIDATKCGDYDEKNG